LRAGLIGTIRRECLDFVIPLNERHVRRVLAEWVAQYNRGRPHASLGPGIPDSADDYVAASSLGHRSCDGYRIVAKSVLGGCTTNTGLSRWLHEPDLEMSDRFCGAQVVRRGLPDRV
jgi:putative transposase